VVLNSFWTDFGEAEAEKVWDYAHRFTALDTQKKGDGNALDEFMTHHFLEQNKETLTVLQMREHLRSVGIEKVKLIPLVHFFIFRYRVDWHKLVNAPQGNQEEIERAQRLLDQVQAAFASAKRAETEAVAREADAKRDEKLAHERAAEAKVAQAELEAALAEVQAQEHAYNSKTEELKRKSEEGSLVQRNKAKNELAQHLGEDPLPLRRAKITQEAAVKKAERTTKAAQEATVVAAEARRKAEAARAAAEEAVEEASRKVAEAEAYLEEVKAHAGGGKGALWWIDRELHEAKAYMPASKGGYKKTK